MSILDDLVLPFLFVPDGQQDSPEAQAFKAEHLDWISFPAWFIPHAAPEAEIGAVRQVGTDREDRVAQDTAAIREGTAFAHSPPPDGAYRIAQEGEPPGEERHPEGEPRSLSEQLRIAEYNTAYTALRGNRSAQSRPRSVPRAAGPCPDRGRDCRAEDGPDQGARTRRPGAGASGRPVAADAAAAIARYAIAECDRRQPSGEHRHASGECRRPRRAVAGVYESQAPGSMLDPKTGAGSVPALRYVNTNTRGADYVEFDGYRVGPDGRVEMIDRKTNVGSVDGRFLFPDLSPQLLRQSDALAQNPGYVGVIEVPQEALASQVRELLNGLGIENISVRVVPLR